MNGNRTLLSLPGTLSSKPRSEVNLWFKSTSASHKFICRAALRVDQESSLVPDQCQAKIQGGGVRVELLRKLAAAVQLCRSFTPSLLQPSFFLFSVVLMLRTSC